MRDFDRLPTRTERVIGVVATALLCIAMAALIVFLLKSVVAGDGETGLFVALAIAVLGFVLSLRSFLRFSFGSPRPSSVAGQFIASMFSVACGLAALVARFAYGTSGHVRTGLAVTALATGVGLIGHAWKRTRSR